MTSPSGSRPNSGLTKTQSRRLLIALHFRSPSYLIRQPLVIGLVVPPREPGIERRRSCAEVVDLLRGREAGSVVPGARAVDETVQIDDVDDLGQGERSGTCDLDLIGREVGQVTAVPGIMRAINEAKRRGAFAGSP